MNTLVRQNASTPAEIQKVFQQYIREEEMRKVFKTHFDSEAGHEHVDSFFRVMLRMYSVETMEKFTRYHTYEEIKSFSNMVEMWTSWERLGRPGAL
jgi:hypothetical protein